jgi:RNA recognition motif-containing protein
VIPSRSDADFFQIAPRVLAPFPVFPFQWDQTGPSFPADGRDFKKCKQADGGAPFAVEESMSKRIYVGNLPFSATEDEIHQLFSQHGTVVSVNLITDRNTGAPRGFGFVEMEEGAVEAIRQLDNQELGGRNLKVNEARPQEKRNSRW